MNRRNFFPLFITCLTVFFFLLVAGGCGGDGDRTKATSATTNAEKMAQVFHGEVVHLPLKRSSESDLEKFLSEVFVLQRSNDRLVPVKTGEKATIRDRMFPFKNGETPKVFNPQESQRTTALLRKMQTKAIDVSAFVSGRFSEDIMNSNVPLRNVEHAMEMSITAGTGSEKNKKSTSNFQSQSESDCEINFPSSTDDLVKWPPCQGPKNIEEELRSRIKK